MRTIFTRIVAVMLTAVMLLQVSDGVLAWAAEDPTANVEVYVPDNLQDGKNYFFIREQSFTISEKSVEKLYIPIQRTGDVSQEADITLKLINLSARYGVNYTASLYGEDVEPTVTRGGVSIVEVAENAVIQQEVEPISEEDAAWILAEQDGADVVNADGDTVGRLNVVPLDENGDPADTSEDGEEALTDESAAGDPASEEEDAAPAAEEEGSALAGLRENLADLADQSRSSPLSLMAGRSAFTGVASDRQELEGGSLSFTGEGDTDSQADPETPLASEDYPGREYPVHFAAGQEVRFLVIDPKYSSAADGDCMVTILLKDIPNGAQVPDDFGMPAFTIQDENRQETVTVSLAARTITAEDGKAAVVVTRKGQVNNMVGVHLSSQDGSAKAGSDYGGVGANLYFPMGITERTVELPVGHGGTEMDFTVTITPLTTMPDVKIGRASARVVIPAAPVVETVGGDAALQDEDGLRFGNVLNLKDICTYKFGHSVEFKEGGQRVNIRSKEDQEDQLNGIDIKLTRGYTLDGMRINYKCRAHYCDGYIEFITWQNFSNHGPHSYLRDEDIRGWHDDQVYDFYFAEEYTPSKMSFRTVNTDNDGGTARFHDRHMNLQVLSVTPILRQFNVSVEQPEALPFEGMTADQVLKKYESYLVDDGIDSRVTGLVAGESFSVSRTGTEEWARLTGLQVKKGDGTYIDLATIDGLSSTVAVTLTEDLINELVEKDCIRWVRGPAEDENTKSGEIRVRPVFEQKDVTVQVRETPDGTLKYNGKELPAGTYTFHKGDKLTFSPNLSSSADQNTLWPVGVGFLTREEGRTGRMLRYGDCERYVDGAVTFTLEDDYYEFWQVFSEINNAVVVRVKTEDLELFNTSVGLFKDLIPDSTTSTSTYKDFVVKKDVLTNELLELEAVPKDRNHVPTWQMENGNDEYSGPTFCFFTSAVRSENLVRLGISTGDNYWFDLEGKVTTRIMNLDTGSKSDVTEAVEGALVTMGGGSSITAEDGSYLLDPVLLSAGTSVRYTVDYNGLVTIFERSIPYTTTLTMWYGSKQKSDRTFIDRYTGDTRTEKTYHLYKGPTDVADRAHNGARFENISVKLNGQVDGIISAVQLSGNQLDVTLTVAPGEPYVFDGQELTETVKDVTVWFQSQITGEIHGIYSTNLREGEKEPGLKWDAATNTATLTIRKFGPDSPEKYTYGDVLMARLTTDKKTVTTVATGKDMAYHPVSTGFAVIADRDWVPETFSLKVPNLAQYVSFLDTGSGSSQDGDKRYSFGKFPWLGEITAVVNIVGVLSASSGMMNYETMQIVEDLEDMMDNAELAGDDGSVLNAGQQADLMGFRDMFRKAAISIYATTKETSYGGVRFLFAVAGTFGSEKYRNRMNPYATKKTNHDIMFGQKAVTNSKSLIYEHGMEEADRQEYVKNTLGGPYFTFGVYIGFYFDFGYVEVVKTVDAEQGKTEQGHSLVFMGGGGFFGAQFTGGWTQIFFPWGIPMYLNAEGKLNITFFLGYSANPKMTIDDYQNNHNHLGEDFGFSLEILGSISLSGSIGIGLYKIIGARLSATPGMALGFSPSMAEWYPTLGTPYGVTTDITFSGTVDLIVTSFDLFSYSWPLPLQYGWMYFTQQARRGNNLIHMINDRINGSHGSAEARAQCRTMADALAAHIDNVDIDGDALKKEVNALRDYAYDKGVIDKDQRNRVNMLRVGGAAGVIEDWVMLNSDKASEHFHTRNHVDSRWVAGENASLQGAFSPVVTSTLMKNAYPQTAAQIQPIGGNRFLVVFIGDGTTRDRMQATQLMWTVYDASGDSWTEPAVVQNDDTADGRPNLIDAGDKLVLSWSSIAPGKLADLAAEVKQELGEGASDADVQAALEADPSRVMALSDIFSVEFDKQDQTFGAIEQLTDDYFYDDTPQAVYDENTGDYMVFYYKTAQDDEAYSDADEKLLDLVGSNTDPTKTYSVLGYMLHNNQTDAKDTNGKTHEAGWARDYYFPNETSQSPEDQAASLARWGGQRFLPSALRAEDGGQTDPPIADLAVTGGNGMASFAFTVDKDFDLDTAEDRELFVQFYDFSRHLTYVPVRIAGTQEEDELVIPEDKGQRGYDIVTSEKQVNVGDPRLIRNEGSTWLFWRQDSDQLRYLNLSDLLTAHVSETEYAVHEDGTISDEYELKIDQVDYGSLMTGDKVNLTEYQVLSDKDENLYVVWTDSILNEEADASEDDTAWRYAAEIYATAKIKETDLNLGAGEEGITPSRWSKPYRLTRDNKHNDGLAIALDDAGNLMILHNQYEMLYADTEEELQRLYDENQIDLVTDEDGEVYVLGSPYYPSPIDLMVTRCAPVGSLEATQFYFSDETPMPGDTVKVTAVIEDVGLTSAHGCEVAFYQSKDGVRGDQIASFSTDEIVPVNTAKKATFSWTVPADGPDGYSIQAVIREKKPSGVYYDPVDSFSDPFTAAPTYDVTVDSCVQNGEAFDVKYTLTNTGNQAASQGTQANLYLQGLYGDLKEQYGMDSDLLIEADISGLAPGETRTVEQTITLPVSVFRFCGYDAVQAVVYDGDGLLMEASDEVFVTMDEPLNLTLNGGSAMQLASGGTQKAQVTYDATIFMSEEIQVVYSVDDPAVAMVDNEGNVTGLSDGTTTLTATLLPSGRTVSVPVTVTGSGGGSGGRGSSAAANPVNLPDSIANGSASSSASQARSGQTVTITVKPDEGYQASGVTVTDKSGSAVPVTDNGDGTYSFTMPASAVSVVPAFTKIGEPTDSASCPKDASCPISSFSDAKPTAWYHDGVHWALDEGIMKGIAETLFAPNDATTRAMVVTMLWRLEGEKDGKPSPFTDVEPGSWYEQAVNWAAETGVVNGTSETTFSPDDPVTREQLAAMLYRSAQAKGQGFTGAWDFPLSFPDADNVSEYAYEPLCWMTMHKVIQGMDDGTLAPRDNATRAQIATMFMRFAEAAAE